jgi:hypothetical protein
MRNALLRGVVVGLVLWSGTQAHSQQATEVYIPIGQSPGLSGKVTIIGTVEAIDPQARSINVTGPAGTWRVTITDRTKIWLDKSKQRVSNQTGSFSDLRKGVLVEVKYVDGERRDGGPADWIKVQVPQ